MAGADQYKASDFIEAIPGSAGIISTIAKRVGCDWHTAKKYIEKHTTVKQAYDDECNKVLDAAESSIIVAITTKYGEGGEVIKEADLPTVKWYLSMKGKQRGYTPRIEFADLDYSNMTIQQLERIARGEDPLHVILSSSNPGKGQGRA